jgi:hypothetical protein
VPDGGGARERGEPGWVPEHVGHEPQPGHGLEIAVPAHGDDHGPLLPAVLQLLQPQIGQRRAQGGALPTRVGELCPATMSTRAGELCPGVGVGE